MIQGDIFPLNPLKFVKGDRMDKEILEKINKFTRRALTEEEIYVFSVILCDNEIDRDCERFSDEALEALRGRFVGKTGIFDHDPSTSNQTARIFDTEIVTDPSKTIKNGEIYKYLKANAYMVRTDENRSLIAEIDGGIKKEVSISCTAAQRICSICGADKALTSCSHVKGRKYNGKLCHTVLGGITDAYEWSFVAVPAQVNAGVTKRFGTEETFSMPVDGDLLAADEELRRDVRKLAYFVGGREASEAAAISARNMTTAQLIALKKSYESRICSGKTELQLMPGSDTDGDSAESEFSMK